MIRPAVKMPQTVATIVSVISHLGEVQASAAASTTTRCRHEIPASASGKGPNGTIIDPLAREKGINPVHPQKRKKATRQAPPSSNRQQNSTGPLWFMLG
jgi:hypothetical protein